MARIFISYRREDSDIWVSRLVEELRKHFPPDQVFQDIASIDPGADFVDVLEQGLATAGVMLAVIGPSWISATDKQGRRRLDLPADFVRQEIAESLRRPGVRVFPLLVNGAEMPSEEELPEPLKPLHRRQAFELTVRHWSNDVAELVQALTRVPGLSGDHSEDEADTRERTRQEAQRRDAEARAEQEEADRIAAEEQARKVADAETRRQAEGKDRRRLDDEARRKAEEEEARRKSAEEARRKTEEEARRKDVEEEARRRVAVEAAQGKAVEEAQRKAAEEVHRKATIGRSGESRTSAGTARKPLAIAGVLAAAVALLVYFSSGRLPDPRYTPVAPPPPSKPEAPAAPTPAPKVETAPKVEPVPAPKAPPEPKQAMRAPEPEPSTKPQPATEFPPIIMAEPPPANYFVLPAIGRKPDTRLRVFKLSERPNQIVDDEDWWVANGLERLTYITGEMPAYVPATLNNLMVVKVIRGNPVFAIYGANFSEGRYLLAIDPTNGKPLFAFDFSLYEWPKSFERTEKQFVQMATVWAYVEGEILYVAHSHRTYARSSKGYNAYVTAIHVSSNRILWRSEPLVCNTSNFVVKDDAIITGYGFTDEKDYLYVLNKADGRVIQQTPLKSGPDYLVQKNDRLYVRTYNTDYIFK